MEELFHIILVKIPNKPSPKEKIIITCYRRWLVCGKIGQKPPPLNKRKLSKTRQEEEDKIKRKLTEANQEWCDWKFQIH